MLWYHHERLLFVDAGVAVVGVADLFVVHVATMNDRSVVSERTS